jgi:GNAT superfamily N-acetyltransferase
MNFRSLDPAIDRAVVRDLYERCADYVMLEQGGLPDEAMVVDFFFDHPPGTDLSQSFKLGLFAGAVLVGIADMAFGYPEPQDAYIGLLLLDPAWRGQGKGSGFVAHLADSARTRGATRLLIAVLDDNRRGRAFWEREDFQLEKTFPPVDIGARTHVRHRMTHTL